jgi:hypothetical protein
VLDGSGDRFRVQFRQMARIRPPLPRRARLTPEV